MAHERGIPVQSMSIYVNFLRVEYDCVLLCQIIAKAIITKLFNYDSEWI